MIAAILSIGGIGFCAAIALGIAAKKFAVEVDPRESAIIDVLSGANCGACGLPGCSAYAKAVVEGVAAPTWCTPGGAKCVEQIANIMGVDAEAQEPEIAVVLCQGDNAKASVKYAYLGIEDCNAAQRIADGPKVCPSGCLGLGSCQRACPFDAIEMTDEGLAVISREKCAGCRKCVAVCPRSVIAMTPASAPTHVLCNSTDKGALVRKYCTVGCIGCQICKKTSPESYKIENFLATVIYDNEDMESPQVDGALDAAAAIEKCPTKCIRDFREGYPDGSSFDTELSKKREVA